MVHLDFATVIRVDPFDRWSYKLKCGARPFKLGFQRFDEFLTGSIGHQRSHLPSCESPGRVEHDAERPGFLHIVSRLDSCFGGLKFPVYPESLRNAVCQLRIDVREMRNHSAANSGFFNLAELEDQRFGDVTLLYIGLTDIKLPSLAVMVCKGLGALADLQAAFLCGKERNPDSCDSRGPPSAPREFGS